MDVATLIRQWSGAGERRRGSGVLVAAGITAWRGRPPPAWDGQRYAGDGHGFSLILRGRGSLAASDGVRHRLSPGMAIHHLPGRAVRGQLAGPAAELWLAFGRRTASALAPLGLLRDDAVLEPGLDPALLAGFAELCRSLAAPVCDGDGPAILAQALDWLHQAYLRNGRGNGDTAWDARIARVCQLMLADLAIAPDLVRIASQIGISEVALRRRFGRRMGCPPMAWWRRQRLQRASELLANASVAEVARLVGYADPTALAKQMRLHLGCSPRSLRRP